MKKYFLLIMFIIILLSCGPSERFLEFKNDNISGIVDSVVTRKWSDLKNYHFLVNDKWYVVTAGSYYELIDYIEKGDSLYKDPDRWDIYVYKKKNGEYTEKYFKGAQGYWD